MPRNSPESLGPDRARKIAEECYGEVLAYCRRHAPAGYDAADLAQETFLRFVRTQGYAERGRPIAYLMRIARSVCVDASRKRRLETVSLDFEVADEERSERESSSTRHWASCQTVCVRPWSCATDRGSAWARWPKRLA